MQYSAEGGLERGVVIDIWSKHIFIAIRKNKGKENKQKLTKRGGGYQL